MTWSADRGVNTQNSLYTKAHPDVTTFPFKTADTLPPLLVQETSHSFCNVGYVER